MYELDVLLANPRYFQGGFTALRARFIGPSKFTACRAQKSTE